MKELFISALIAIQSFLGLGGQPIQKPEPTTGATVFRSSQVGTSPSSGYYLQTDGTNSSWQPVVGGGGSGGGTFSTTTCGSVFCNFPNNVTDVVVIGSTATSSGEVFFDPNAQSYRIGSSNTASTTLMGNVYFPTKSQGFAYLGSNSQLNSLASSSILLQDLGGAVTDAQVPNTITVDLATAATALFANGTNASAGNAILGVDASGNAEGAFDVWTEAENTSAGYVAGTRTLTVAGTANQITSSAGAQDLSANRTWTLSFPNQIIFPQYASSTLGFSTPYASSTFQNIGTLTFGGVTGSAWSSFCTSITGSADLCDGSDASGAGGSSAYEIATTSDIALSQLAYIAKVSGRTTLASVATSTLGVAASLSTSGTLGYQVGGTNSTLSLNMANANTWTAKQDFFGAASSTLFSSNWLKVGATASTTIDTAGNVSLPAAGTLTIPALTSALTLTGAGGELAEYTGTSCTNQFVRSLSALGVATCATVANTDLANSTISGVALGSNLNALTNDTTLNGSSYNGSSAISDWGLNLANANTWTVNQTFNYSSSTAYSSFVTASSTNLFLGTGQGALYTGSGQRVTVVATSTPTVTAPITYSGTLGQFLGGSSGTFDCTSANGSTKGCITSTDWTTFNNKLSSYDAFSHTLFGGQAGGNFFSATTSMMAIGTSTAPNNLSALTISSSTASQLSLSAGAGISQWTMRNAGGNLYFSTTTVAGTATSSVAALTIDTNGQGIWQTLKSLFSLIIPNSTNPTVDTVGQIAINTTAASSSVRYYDGVAERTLYPTEDKVFSFASSTLSYLGGYGATATTTILLGNYSKPITLTNFYCKTNVGTALVQFGDGTASTTYATCSTTGGEVAAPSNNTWTMRENFLIGIGSQTSSPGSITVTASIRQDAD